MKVGIFIGKFMPLHKGHVRSIIEAYTKCDKLYVLLCYKDSDPIPRFERELALSKLISDLDNVDHYIIDETNVPEYPNGFEIMCNKFRTVVENKIDYVFCGEKDYIDGFNKFMPEAEVILLDPNRSIVPISATKIRSSPYKYWEFISDYIKNYYTKKILITGTESCGKSTISKLLCKINDYELISEYGREYVETILDGDESHMKPEDFSNIISKHRLNEEYTFKFSNKKVVISDTDSIVTEYYYKLYLGVSPDYKIYHDPNRYDLVFLLSPTVKWVDDGMRMNGDQDKRFENHEVLKKLYLSNGFGYYDSKIIEVTGTDYDSRLNFINNKINEILK